MLPSFAPLVTSGACSVITVFGLVPAILVRFPAGAFVGAAWKRLAAPVVVLDGAVGGLESHGLFRLAGSDLEIALRRATGVDWGSELGEWEFQWLLPDVVGHGCVGHVDISWYRDGVFRSGVATRSKEDLSTAHVELRICGCLVCLVQCQNLRAHQVVASCEVCWDVDRKVTIAGGELFCTPLASSAVVVLLEDLEPPITNRLISRGVINLLHVDRASTSVTRVDRAGLGSIRPVAELESHPRTCVCAANTRHSVHAIDAACHIVTRDGGPDRAEGVSRFLDVAAHPDASAIALVDVVDEEIGERGMGIDSGSSSQGQQDTIDMKNMHI